MQRFMNSNNLSPKKATMITKVWMDCTTNPFIIYKFYDRLEEIICENNSEDIWNMDETAFCLDPKKSNNYTEGIQGQNFQQSWRGDKALPNTFYGVSAKGWMTTQIMLKLVQTIY